MQDWITLFLLTILFITVILESQSTTSAAVGEFLATGVALGALVFIVTLQIRHHPAEIHHPAALLASCDIPHICQGAKTPHTATP